MSFPIYENICFLKNNKPFSLEKSSVGELIPRVWTAALLTAFPTASRRGWDAHTSISHTGVFTFTATGPECMFRDSVLWGIAFFSPVWLSLLVFWGAASLQGFPGGSDGKESVCNTGDLGSIPGLGRSSGGGHGNLLQYPCLKNSMERRAWWPTVQRVTKSWPQPSGHTGLC